MNRLAYSTFALGFALALVPACGLSVDSTGIGYNMEPQEFMQDFGAQQQGQAGMFPSVDCSGMNAAVCSMIPNVPAGATASCDKPSGKCIGTYTVRKYQEINLSQQKAFPQSVANSSVISSVKVGAVHYWTATNTLDVATPPIDIYVGPQGAKTETDAGVTHLGTMPMLPAMGKTACRPGTPGTETSACDMPLTDAGKSALGNFAKNYKTPFNAIISTTLTVHAGEPVPAGKLDLFVQPELSFVL